MKTNTFARLKAASIRKAQTGFTIIELIVVISLIAVLTAVAAPRAVALMIDAKVGPTAGDINKIVTKIRANFQGQGATPYTNLGLPAAATAVFANTARGLGSAMTVNGAGATATITHDIGATGSLVAVAQATITTAGDAFTATFPTVNHAACPNLAAQLARSAEVISINGTVVKALNGVYNGGTAQNLCTNGDTNTFVFTFR